MKKANFTYLRFVCFALCCLLFGWQNASAQINHVTTGSQTETTCSNNFFDSGGVVGNYSTGEDGVTTICPTDPVTDIVEVTFNSFSVEDGWDGLYIYDGDNTGATLIPGCGDPFNFPAGAWDDDCSLAGSVISASGASGCLTFEFLSDGSVTQAGWDAAITCAPRPSCSTPSGLASAGETTDGADLSWVSGNPDVTGHTWDVEIGLPGFSPGTGNELQAALGLTTQSYTVTGLNSATTYQFNVLEHCDGADGDSEWSDALFFTTLPDYCGGDQYLDSGGLGGAYGPNEDITTVICPDNPTDFVAVKFNSFSVEDGWDGLYVYDSDSADPAALIPGCGDPFAFPPGAWDDDCPADLFFSTHASGCLTFNFLSDGSVNQAGWDADVLCAATLPEVNITDPCSCNNDHNPIVGGLDDDSGTFGEEITITTANVGDTWTVSAVTGLNNTNVGDAFTDGGAGDADGAANGTIVIQDSHNDGVGYTIEVTDGFFTLNIGNTCHYPKPSIDLASFTYCTNSPPIPLSSSEANGATGAASFTINGNPAMEIDPAALGAGNHLLVLTFDAGTATPFDVTDPGCIQEVHETITVNQAPTSITCNDQVQISLDDACSAIVTPDMILEGADGCDASYTVDLENALGQSLGNVLDAGFIGGPWIVRVTEIVSGNSCWGSVVVEDKVDPDLVCPPSVSVPCNADVAPGASSPISFLPQTLVDNSGITVPFNVPAGAAIGDVDVLVNLQPITGDLYSGNIRMFITSPSGTTVTLWLTVFGCGTLPIWAIFDDEGTAALTCASISTGQPHQILFGAGVLSDFDGEDPQGTWELEILEVDGGGDSAELTEAAVIIDGVQYDPPTSINIEFPNGLTAAQLTQVDANTWIVPAGLIDACTEVTLSYLDDTSNEDCPSGNVQIITRIWTAVDASGNESTCVQTITKTRPTLNDVVFPIDRDGVDGPAFDCDNNPAWDANGNGYPDASEAEAGVPTVFGAPFNTGDLCGLSVEFEDNEVEVCPGTVKILRTWTVIDWCAGESIEATQIVKVLDDEGPSIVSPGDLTIDVYEASSPAAGVEEVCSGHVVIPAAGDNGDNCSSIASWETQLWNGGDLLQTIPSNGGIFWDVELLQAGQPAQYTIRYKATDQCGNESEELINIFLQDKIPPVAICDEITEVTITNSGATGEGCSVVYAEDLDDGSYGNCAPVIFLVADMPDFFPFSALQFRPYVEYCCDDIGENTAVLMVIEDSPAVTAFIDGLLGTIGFVPGSQFDNGGADVLNGRFNNCMVQVLVDDKLPPINISCPANDEITCDEYWDTLEADISLCNGDDDCENAVLSAAGFGDPEFYDNCSLNIDVTVTINLDQCGEGSITRSWSATDDAGNGPATCTQTILVHHVSDFVVEFPADITAVCVAGDDAPDFGEPEIFFESCELVAVSYEDTQFDVVADACYKIVRDWTVINWCVIGDDIDEEHPEDPENGLGLPFPLCDLDGDGDCDDRTFRDSWSFGVYPDASNATDQFGPDSDSDSDPWDGYIVYQQVIKVIDNEAPTFADGCAIDDVCIWDGCATDVTLPSFGADDCSDDVTTIVESTTLPNGSGFGPYTNVAPGTYEVVYAAFDNCGNSTACASTVTVVDCKNPTPYCVDGLVITLMNTDPPMVDVWAVDFDAGSFDNCGVDCISFSPDCSDTQRIYDCEDIGNNSIEIWVTDIYGNQDFCETFVVVDPGVNVDLCLEDDNLVAGNISNESNEDVENVTVELSGQSDQVMTTDASGDFNFNVPVGSDVTVTPSKDVNPLNGVTTFDLVKISKHILNVEALNSPYKMIAADANRSGSITTFDLVSVRKLILYIDTDFPNNTSWRFVPADYTFANPANPFNEAFPEVININNISADQLAQDFVAIKVGDVNGSASANNLLGADDRNMNGALTLVAEDMLVKAGETYSVEFTARNFNNYGYQFTMDFEGLNFVEVGSGLASADNFGFSLLEEGALTASWNKAEAVELSTTEAVFTLTFTATTTAQLSELVNISSRYTAAEAYAANGDLQDVNIEFNGTVVANGFELYQNTPNPFSDITTIGFNLPEASAATIRISDVSGRLLKVIEGDFAKGYNQVEVSREELPAVGVMYYQLDTDNNSATKKMIVID